MAVSIYPTGTIMLEGVAAYAGNCIHYPVAGFSVNATGEDRLESVNLSGDTHAICFSGTMASDRKSYSGTVEQCSSFCQIGGPWSANLRVSYRDADDQLRQKRRSVKLIIDVLNDATS
jgi:hypothetical protein